MTNEEFKQLVAEMRAAQKKYFENGRYYSDLTEAKRLEKMVDSYLKPDLFSK